MWTDYFVNVTSYPDMLTATNSVTHNLFGVTMLLVVFVVALAWGAKEDLKRAIAAASFITMLFSFFFGALNLVNGDVVLICIVVTGLSVFALRKD